MALLFPLIPCPLQSLGSRVLLPCRGAGLAQAYGQSAGTGCRQQTARTHWDPIQAAAATGSAGPGHGPCSSPACGTCRWPSCAPSQQTGWGGLAGGPQEQLCPGIASGHPRHPCTLVPRVGAWGAGEAMRSHGVCLSAGMGPLWAQPGPAGRLFSSSVPRLGRRGLLGCLCTAVPPTVSEQWGRIRLRAGSRKEGRKESRVKISQQRGVGEARAGASSQPPGRGSDQGGLGFAWHWDTLGCCTVHRGWGRDSVRQEGTGSWQGARCRPRPVPDGCGPFSHLGRMAPGSGRHRRRRRCPSAPCPTTARSTARLPASPSCWRAAS